MVDITARISQSKVIATKVHIVDAVGLDGLTNVTLTSPADGSYIIFRSSDNQFINDNTIVKTSTGITLTGELAATSLDISGNADIDGVLETDSLTINTDQASIADTGIITSKGLIVDAGEVNIKDAADINGATTRLTVGTGDDLLLYHFNNDSYIKEVGTGSLIIQSNNVVLKNHLGSQLLSTDLDSAQLFYATNGSNPVGKLETAVNGVSIFGSLILDDGVLGNTGNTTTLVENAASDIVLTLPSTTGTIALSGANVATTQLTGTITNAQLAGSIANAKLSNSSITVSDGSNTSPIALGGTLSFAGTSNEVTVAENAGTFTIGLPDDVTIAGDLSVATAPTAGAHVTNKTYVDAQVANVVDSAPAALNTLNELAAALGDDASFATTTATTIGEKLAKASNLSDLANTGTAKTNLGLGNVEDKSSATIRGEIVDSDIPASIARDSELTSFITASSSDTLTNKSIGATQLTGTIDNGRLPAAATSITSVGTLSGLTTGATVVNGALTVNNDLASIVSTDAGAAVAPIFELYRNSASPAVSDRLGSLNFTGNLVSGGAKVTYASIDADISASPGSNQPKSMLRFNTYVNGSQVTLAQLDNQTGLDLGTKGLEAGYFTIGSNSALAPNNTINGGLTINNFGSADNLELVDTVPSNVNSDPRLSFYRDSSSPADNDHAGRIEFYANNDADQKTNTAGILHRILDVTDGTEDGELTFGVMQAGAFNTLLTLDPNGVTVDGELTVNADTLKLTSTVASSTVEHPSLELYRNGGVGSADLGAIKFFGNNNADPLEKFQYAGIYASVQTSADGSEQGSLAFSLGHNGAQEDPAMSLFSYGLQMGYGNPILMSYSNGYQQFFSPNAAQKSFKLNAFPNATVDNGAYDIYLPDVAGGTLVAANSDKAFTAGATTVNGALTVNSDLLKVVSTDAGAVENPILALYRNSSSIATSDELGAIEFRGNDANGAEHLYGRIYSEISLIGDGAEQGNLNFAVGAAGGLEDPVMRLRQYALEMGPGNDIYLSTTGTLIFEGASPATAHETTLYVVNPTADRTILLPDAAGTIVLKDSTDTLTNKSIVATQLTGTIDNARLPAAATSITSVGTLSGLTTGATTVNGALTVNSDLLEITSTVDDATEKPIISLWRTGAANTANDELGAIRWFGQNASDEKQFYGGIYVQADDVTDGAHKGSLNFHLADGSNNGTAISDVLVDINGDEDPTMSLTSELLTVNANVLIKAIVNDNAVNATPTPILELFHSDGPSADDGDHLGEIQFTALNDNSYSPAKHKYAGIHAEIIDESNATEDGSLHFTCIKAGTEDNTVLTLNGSGSTLFSDLIAPLTISSNTTDADLIITNSLDSADASPIIKLHREAGPNGHADGDDVGKLEFHGTNDRGLSSGGPEDVLFGSMFTEVVDSSDGTEDGQIKFTAIKAGSATDVLTLNGSGSTLTGSLEITGGVTASQTLVNAVTDTSIDATEFASYSGKKVVYTGGAGTVILADAVSGDLGKGWTIVNAGTGAITIDRATNSQTIKLLNGSAVSAGSANLTLATGGVIEITCTAADNYIAFGSGIS